MDNLISTRRQNLVLTRKKKNLIFSGFCRSSRHKMKIKEGKKIDNHKDFSLCQASSGGRRWQISPQRHFFVSSLVWWETLANITTTTFLCVKPRLVGDVDKYHHNDISLCQASSGGRRWQISPQRHFFVSSLVWWETLANITTTTFLCVKPRLVGDVDRYHHNDISLCQASSGGRRWQISPQRHFFVSSLVWWETLANITTTTFLMIKKQKKRKLWNMRVTVVAIVIAALDTVPQGLEKKLV